MESENTNQSHFSKQSTLKSSKAPTNILNTSPEKSKILSLSKKSDKNDLPIENISNIQEKPIDLINDPTADLWNIIPTLYQFSNIENGHVLREKSIYLRSPDSFLLISDRAKPFLYFIFNEIKKRNLPSELALLPIIESSYQSYAYSHGSAAGLWQFIPSTGKYFGLKQDWWYDGRRDLYQSTHAALDYLEKLNKRFDQDWLLTLAAYNAGAGTINKAIRKNKNLGKGVSFWDLSLPKETTAYVPRLIAVAQILEQREKNRISLEKITNSPFLHRIDVESQIDLAIAAKLADISIEDIYNYNPGFNQWASPPSGPHQLFMPISSVEKFNTKIANLDKSKFITRTRYLIKPGDSLSVIARKHNVSVNDIKVSNKLKNHRIRAGKYLSIPSANQESLQYGEDIVSRRNAVLKRIQRHKRKVHRVKAGESLWTIARKYKISYTKLAKLNRISTKRVLSIGQKLIVWSKGKSFTKKSRKKPSRLVYKVKQGDSFYRIAKKHKTSTAKILAWNKLDKNKYLRLNQKLILFP